MLMFLTGRLPRTGDTVEWEGWRFEIIDMDGKKIDKVLAVRPISTAIADTVPA
jgi:putative hemolysin